MIQTGVHGSQAQGDSSEQQLVRALDLQNQGRLSEAEALFRQVLPQLPTSPVALYSLAVILLNTNRPEEALRFAEQGVQSNPGFSQLWFARGIACRNLYLREQALASLEEALRLKPDYVEALVNIGVLLHDLHQPKEALLRFQRVLELEPDNATALGNYGILLTEFKLGEEAVAAFEHLLKVNPDYPYGLGLLLYERMHHCDWTDLQALTGQITEGLRQGKPTCKTLAYMALSDSAEDHYTCGRIFAERYHGNRPSPLWRGERYRHPRIRVAYVSPDLREHPVGHLMAGVVEGHDKGRFETIGISLGLDDQSRIRARMMAAFDHFIDAKDMHALEIAELMRRMEVDIAIDLAGYTSDSRTEIFLHRPAPIQVNYLGYPGTMALDCYDYILADRTVIPQDDQGFYSEKPAYLEHCYLPIASGIEVAEPLPRSQYGLPENGFVFCAFSHDYKIHPDLFSIWMRLLEGNPGSVLWLMSRNESSQRNLRRAAEAQGVAPDRLVFASRVPRVEDHLARYRVADLFLDTWPYNAHTTAADALLAGLPVVTYRGAAFPARVASSLLETLGLPELITESLEGYFDLAHGFAQHPRRLQKFRKRLAPEALQGHPFLGQSFTRGLEKVLESMEPREMPELPEEPPQEPTIVALPLELNSASDPLLDSARSLLEVGNLPQAELFLRASLAGNLGNTAALRLLDVLREGYGIPRDFELTEHGPEPEAGHPRFLLIKPWGFGFWSEAHHLASQLLLAELTHRVPILASGSPLAEPGSPFQPIAQARWEDLSKAGAIYPRKWHRDNLDEAAVNTWEGADSRRAAQFLMARPEQLVVSDFFSTLHSIIPWIGRSSAYFGLDEDHLYGQMFRKHFQPTPVVAAGIDAAFERFLKGRPWVAVHALKPGTDPGPGSGLPLLIQYFGFVDRMLGLNPELGIYLLTDAPEALDPFRARYGDRVLCRPLAGDDPGGSGFYDLETAMPCREALIEMLLALRCDHFLGNRFSNFSLALSSLRDWPSECCFLLGGPNVRSENLALHHRSQEMPVQRPPRRLRIGGVGNRKGWEWLGPAPTSGSKRSGTAADLASFPRDVFDEVHASESLERMDYSGEVQQALEAWLRILKPGGRLSLSVPDLDALARVLLDKARSTPDERLMAMRLLFGRHADAGDRNAVGFNEEFLVGFLAAAGFTNIRRVEAFEHLDEADALEFKGLKVSLHCTAEKPR